MRVKIHNPEAENEFVPGTTVGHNGVDVFHEIVCDLDCSLN